MPNRIPRIRRPPPVGVFALLAVLLLTACESGTPQPAQTVPPPQQQAELTELLPQRIRDRGALRIATDPSYPPMEFTADPSGQVQGFDIDLAAGVATTLGLRPRYTAEAYTAIPRGVRSGRFDLGIASLTIVPGRKLLTDAVLYYRTGTLLARRRTQPGLTDDTQCGFRIAALEGSVQIEQLTGVSRRCHASGRDRIVILPFSTMQGATATAAGGGADGLLADSPATQYAIDENSDVLEAAGHPTDPAPLGMLTSADTPKLAKAVREAVQLMIDSGYYAQLLDRWGITHGGVASARIKRAA